jgi:hypothetical protein
MRTIIKISILFILAASAPASAAEGDAAVVESGAALQRATAAVLASGAVPALPRDVDREQLVQALQDYPFCGGSMEAHARALGERFGERVALATMNLIVTDPSFSLLDLSRHLVVLRAWVQAGQASGDRLAALVTALRGQAETIVVGRTAALAAELTAVDLAGHRAFLLDLFRRDLVQSLAGNGSARAVREVDEALRSESPRVRAAAAVVARTLPGQPLREAVESLCASDIQSVRNIACGGT